MTTKKVLMGQPLLNTNGEALMQGGLFGVDARHMSILQGLIINKAELDQEARDKLVKQMNEIGLRPLQMYDVICTALEGGYEDEKTLDIGEKMRRRELIKKCYRKGMAKLADSDIEYIVKMVNKCYPGSLVAPQVKALLEGKEVKMGLAEGDEDDEVGPKAVEAPKQDAPS